MEFYNIEKFASNKATGFKRSFRLFSKEFNVQIISLNIPEWAIRWELEKEQLINRIINLDAKLVRDIN